MEKLLKKIIAHNSGSALVTIKIEDKASEEEKLKSLKERGDIVRYSTLGDNHWLCTLNKQIASTLPPRTHTRPKRELPAFLRSEAIPITLLVIILTAFFFFLAFNTGGGGSSTGKCSACKGSGMVNTGFVDFKTCPVCKGGGGDFH